MNQEENEDYWFYQQQLEDEYRKYLAEKEYYELEYIKELETRIFEYGIKNFEIVHPFQNIHYPGYYIFEFEKEEDLNLAKLILDYDKDIVIFGVKEEKEIPF